MLRIISFERDVTIILIHSPPNILISEVVVLTVNEVVDDGDNCWRCAGDARN